MRRVSEFSTSGFIAAIFILFTAALLTSCDEPSDASEFPECFVGTYLNKEGSGADSIWTFHKGGTFSGESSTQEELNFSGQLGSWVRTGPGEARIVLLDFSFDDEGIESNIARADIDITFKGENCGETEGSFELRFFQEGEDPLDLSTYQGEVIEDTFTGRKLVL